MGQERTDTELVLAARGDDPAAFGELFERWFDRAWNVARTIVRDDDLAADVAQDTMVKAWQQLDQLNDVDAFGGWLLRSTRNRALNRLAREGRSRASGDDIVSGLRDRGGEDPVGAERLPEPDQVNEIRDRQELVWAAATALGERDLSLLDLHLRHGLSPAEIADELGVEANAAHQQLFRLRGRLGDAIGSYLLWRHGRPLCEGLAEAVSGRTAFDRSVARSVARHQANCEHCSEERESMVDPSKLFAAVPLLLVPPHLKAEAAAALQSAGVPTDASGASAESGSSTSDPSGAESANSPDLGGADAVQASGSNAGGSDGGASGGGAGDGGAGGGSGGASSGGIQIDLGVAAAKPPPVAMAPGVALADQASGLGAGPSGLAPTLGLPRGRAAMLAGAGIGVVVALVALGAFLFRDGGSGDSVAAIGSDTPEPLAASQDSDGDDASGGTASFSPSSSSASTTEAAPASPSSVAPTATSRATTTRDRTTATTGSSTTQSTTSTSVSTTEPSVTTPTSGTTGTTPTTGTTTGTTPTTGTTSTTDPFTTSTFVTVTSTVTVSVTQPPDPPIIVRFTSRISRTGLNCGRTQRTFDAVWATENANAVALDLGGSTATGGPSGSHTFCGTPGSSIRLTATGPGGNVSATTTL